MNPLKAPAGQSITEITSLRSSQRAERMRRKSLENKGGIYEEKERENKEEMGSSEDWQNKILP